jgi:hypothetical protein
MDNLTVAGNTTTGIEANSGIPVVTISRSLIMGSKTGVINNIGSQFISYQNNFIDINDPTPVNGTFEPGNPQ